MKKKSITPKEIADIPLVLYDRTTSTRARLDRFFKLEMITPKIVLELSSVETMQTMVEVGLGGTIIPASAFLGGAHRKNLKNLRIRGNPPTREVGIAMPHFSRLPSVVDEMLQVIRERCREIKTMLA